MCGGERNINTLSTSNDATGTKTTKEKITTGTTIAIIRQMNEQ